MKNPTYETVVIAIDVNGAPEQVLQQAQKVIDPEADVHILNVAFDPSSAYAYFGASGFMNNVTMSAADQSRLAAHGQLEQLLDKHNFPHANRCVELGHAAEVIISVANDLQADLIIVGSHGRSGVRLLLGSTANAVLHHAKCDVLTIRVYDEPEQLHGEDPQPS